MLPMNSSLIPSGRPGLRTAGLGFLLTVVLLAGPGPASARTPGFRDARGFLKVDGVPRVVLGMYENPKDDAVLAEAVRCGITLFQSRPEIADLDRLQRAGAKAWVNLGEALDLSREAASRREALGRVVNRVKHHPALLLWEGPDEILWNQWWVPLEAVRAELRTLRAEAVAGGELARALTRAQEALERGFYPEFEAERARCWQLAGRPCPQPGLRVDDAPARVRSVGEGITEGIRFVRGLDPTRAVWLNHAPRNSLGDLAHFNREADVAGCDIYPVPANLEVGHSDLRDMTLGSVGTYTRRMREAAPGRICAMVLQGFGWRDLRESSTEAQLALGVGRRPVLSESRFMAYDALLNGAGALLWWGTAYLKPAADDPAPGQARPRLWRDLLQVGRELRALEPALVARPEEGWSVRVEPTFGSHEVPPIRATLRRVQDDDVLIVMNVSPHGVRFRIDGLPGRLNGRTLHRLRSDEARPVAGRRWEDGIKGWQVQVYATSRRFEPGPATP